MVQIEKYSGGENDFFIVNASESISDRRAFAAYICDRHEGVDYPGIERQGADGVVFLALEKSFEPPRLVMTLVQPDGSIAPMCGNALACAAGWASEQTGEDELMIDTQSGTRRAVVDGGRVTVEMGTPTFDSDTVPVVADEPLIAEEIAGLDVTAVTADIPHAVSFVDDPDDVDLATVGPEIDASDRFSSGTNVTVATQIGDTTFSQRTYKRGVDDEIDSCGTGAVAVFAAARRLGFIDDEETATVEYPGGTLTVHWSDDSVGLESPVERVFAGACVADDSSATSAALD